MSKFARLGILAILVLVRPGYGQPRLTDVSCDGSGNTAGLVTITCSEVSTTVEFAAPAKDMLVRFHAEPGSSRTVVMDKSRAIAVVADRTGVIDVFTGFEGATTLSLLLQDPYRKFDYSILPSLRFLALLCVVAAAVLPCLVFVLARFPTSRYVVLPLIPMLLFLYNTRHAWSMRTVDLPTGAGIFDKAEAFEAYERSQYVLGWKHPEMRVINDQQIYTFAGWMYAHGSSPDLVNPEHPPLGKYLLGMATRLFMRPTVATLVSGLVAVWLVSLISRRVFDSWLISLVPGLIVANSRLIVAYSSQTYMDIFVMLAFCLGIWLLLACGQTMERGSVLCVAGMAVLLGVGMSIKWSFVVFGLLVVAYLGLGRRWNQLILFVACAPLMVVAYLSAYWRFFEAGNTFRDFIALQAGVLRGWTELGSSGISPFSLWRILMTGYAEYGGYYTRYYSFVWPLLALLGVLGTGLAVRCRRFDVALCGGWFLGYMLFFSNGPTWDRYLVPMWPGAAIVSVWAVVEVTRLMRVYFRSRRTREQGNP